ncbi:HEAT repeat domain-containing protein [Saccharopolyspora elongata]|uniref:HEAT repeat domain-containing protein n=1 Tax=Saccharopolyspora elongata TaxID=2530387 RepID=A0A4R4ZCB1_9PSEU|nr:HEAT repeat domain-containing protein [Saccharopolyspora elongata]TDD53952.1 HEAT repeat domain-containing protein [Saccharopolyspora elongata]
MPFSLVHQGLRFILRESEPESRLDSFAAEFGWEKAVRPERDGMLREVVWSGYNVDLRFVVDDVTGCPYFFFTTGMWNSCLSLTKLAAGRLDVYSREELFAALESARSVAERRHALLMVALGGPHGFDEDVFEVIRDALGAPEAEIRKAAVYAMSYTPSVRYKPMLGSLRERDPDPGVRADADPLLEVMAEVGTGGV